MGSTEVCVAPLDVTRLDYLVIVKQVVSNGCDHQFLGVRVPFCPMGNGYLLLFPGLTIACGYRSSSCKYLRGAGSSQKAQGTGFVG